MLQVTKRDGSQEQLDLEKLHTMTRIACEGLNGVSASQIEMSGNIQFYDGIKTSDIQEILIKSASDLISLDHPNYQYAAARLLLFAIKKEVFGGLEYPHLQQIIDQNIKNKVYDPAILEAYNQKEIAKANSWIKHDRDLDFAYAGLRQVADKYLIQDRSTGQLYETPQYMYMMIALTMFSQYPKTTRMDYVKRFYNAVSQFKINLPTPIMSGVRTPIKQFASCCLIDINDTLNSISAGNSAIMYYTAQRSGIGVNYGRIRSINSKIRGGEVRHTGVVPFIKVTEAITRSVTQNGVRGGNATVNFPIWSQEITSVFVLKNNKGTEETRARKMDYCIQFSKLFYQRFLENKAISLFNPADVPNLYPAWGTVFFDDLYLKYERAHSIPKVKISAQELFGEIIKERVETGRIYIMNIDHCNTHSSFTDTIKMTNLCTEITLPTTPPESLDDKNAEIALCILSALNLGKIKELSELEELCDLMVRSLDALIDYQNYPVISAEISTKKRRSLGIGYIDLAHYLAKRKIKYSDKKAAQLIHDTTEAFQYYLLKASNNLAKELGPCEWFEKTKYSQGILPIDTYKPEVDDVIEDSSLKYDWETLREDIKKYGLRNSTLTAQMPSESSSVVTNSTNGIEPPRGYLSVKKSKKGTLKQIVPEYYNSRSHYELLWDMKSNEGYMNIVAVMQKFFDQSISANTSYNPENYEKNEIPMSVITKDILTAYKLGLKTLYYNQVYDGKVDADEIELPILQSEELAEESDCDACAI